MEAEFGKEAPLNKSRGKVHNYLGMQMDFSNPGEVKIDMVNYIKTILNEVPSDMLGAATSPAANHLFDVDQENPKLLDEERRKTFVHITMQFTFTIVFVTIT